MRIQTLARPVADQPTKLPPLYRKSAGVVELTIDAPVEQIIAQASGKSFVHVAHPNHPDGHNIIGLARKDGRIKQIVVALANAGFHLYVCRDKVSSFVFHSRIPSLWEPVRNGEFQHQDGVIYSLKLPNKDMPARRLVVVFSSIGEKMYSASLMRYFYTNYKTIEKYLPPNTAVLRIADIGSVASSFYLGNNFDPHNDRRVHALVRKVQTDLRITKDSVVLYGTSKGGTGALYHALVGNYHAVSVDPITADEHYINRFNDSHFTVGTFPADKSQVFAELTRSCVTPTASITVITSPQSPQYAYIDRIIRCSPVGHALNYLESESSRIKDHPDVAGQTLHMHTMLINMAFYGMKFTAPNVRVSV